MYLTYPLTLLLARVVRDLYIFCAKKGGLFELFSTNSKLVFTLETSTQYILLFCSIA